MNPMMVTRMRDPSDANEEVISVSPAAPCGECHKRSENGDELKKLNGAGFIKMPLESAIRDPKMYLALLKVLFAL